jgi:hypothetical protein
MATYRVKPSKPIAVFGAVIGCRPARDSRLTVHDGWVPAHGCVISASVDGRATVIRTPDGLLIGASGRDDVWAACPEFGVPIVGVSVDSQADREAIVASRGSHPDMPSL